MASRCMGCWRICRSSQVITSACGAYLPKYYYHHYYYYYYYCTVWQGVLATCNACFCCCAQRYTKVLLVAALNDSNVQPLLHPPATREAIFSRAHASFFVNPTDHRHRALVASFPGFLCTNPRKLLSCNKTFFNIALQVVEKIAALSLFFG